jgi:hypothetical protein
MIAPSRGIVLHNSCVVVARQQCHQRRGSLGRVRRHFPRAAIAVCDPGLSSCPPWAVAIGWPERQRSTSHIAKMLNQPERIKFDIIDGARASVPRHPRGAHPRGREFQYCCNRCLCVHSYILTRLCAPAEAPTYQFCCCRNAREPTVSREVVEQTPV